MPKAARAGQVVAPGSYLAVEKQLDRAIERLDGRTDARAMLLDARRLRSVIANWRALPPTPAAYEEMFERVVDLVWSVDALAEAPTDVSEEVEEVEEVDGFATELPSDPPPSAEGMALMAATPPPLPRPPPVAPLGSAVRLDRRREVDDPPSRSLGDDVSAFVEPAPAAIRGRDLGSYVAPLVGARRAALPPLPAPPREERAPPSTRGTPTPDEAPEPAPPSTRGFALRTGVSSVVSPSRLGRGDVPPPSTRGSAFAGRRSPLGDAGGAPSRSTTVAERLSALMEPSMEPAPESVQSTTVAERLRSMMDASPESRHGAIGERRSRTGRIEVGAAPPYVGGAGTPESSHAWATGAKPASTSWVAAAVEPSPRTRRPAPEAGSSAASPFVERWSAIADADLAPDSAHVPIAPQRRLSPPDPIPPSYRWSYGDRRPAAAAPVPEWSRGLSFNDPRPEPEWARVPFPGAPVHDPELEAPPQEEIEEPPPDSRWMREGRAERRSPSEPPPSRSAWSPYERTPPPLPAGARTTAIVRPKTRSNQAASPPSGVASQEAARPAGRATGGVDRSAPAFERAEGSRAAVRPPSPPQAPRELEATQEPASVVASSPGVVETSADGVTIVAHTIALPLPSDDIVLLSAPYSDRANAFRTLRRRLATAGNPRTVAVSSANAGEGKTSTAINLALALLEGARGKVLLVEANPRSPGVAKALGFEPPSCFVEQMNRSSSEGGASPAAGADRNRWIVVEPTPKLHVLAVSSLREHAPLLDSVSFASAMEQLKRGTTYEYVVIDTPPVLGSTNVNVIVDAVDGLLLTAVLMRSKKDPLKKAIEQVMPAPILGVLTLEG